MKLHNRIFAGAVGLSMAFLFMGCGTLNPKTEGQISSALEAKKDDFTKCYEKALTTDREVKGSMKLALKFEPKSTKPQETSIAKTDIGDAKMQKCVRKAADGIRIEDAPGVYVDGFYTVDFQYNQ